MLRRCPPKLTNDIRCGFDALEHIRFREVADGVVVRMVAVALKVGEVRCELDDLPGESSAGGLFAPLLCATVFHCPVCLSPSLVAAVCTFTADKGVCTAGRKAVKEGVVRGAHGAPEVALARAPPA